MAKVRPFLVLPGMTVSCSTFEGEVAFDDSSLTELVSELHSAKNLDDFRATASRFGEGFLKGREIKFYAYNHQEGALSFVQNERIVVNFRKDEMSGFDYSCFKNQSGKTVCFLRKESYPPYYLPDGHEACFHFGGRLLSTSVEGDSPEDEVQ